MSRKTRLVSISKAAALTSLTEAEIERRVSQGAINSTKYEGEVYVSLQAVKDFSATTSFDRDGETK